VLLEAGRRRPGRPVPPPGQGAHPGAGIGPAGAARGRAALGAPAALNRRGFL